MSFRGVIFFAAHIYGNLPPTCSVFQATSTSFLFWTKKHWVWTLETWEDMFVPCTSMWCMPNTTAFWRFKRWLLGWFTENMQAKQRVGWMTYFSSGRGWVKTHLVELKKRFDTDLCFVCLFVCLFVIHLFFWLGFVFEMGHHMYNIRSVIKFDMISIYTFSSPFWNPDPFCSQFWLAPEKKHQTEVFFSWVFHWQFHVHFLFLRCDFLLAAGWLVSLWTGSLYASNNDGKVFLQLLSLAKTGGNGISQSKDNRSWPSKLPLVKTAPTVNIGDN